MSELYEIHETTITTRNGKKCKSDQLVETYELHCSNCETTTCIKWIIYDACEEENALHDIFICQSKIYCPNCGYMWNNPMDNHKKEPAC
jgi:hypothetical protein